MAFPIEAARDVLGLLRTLYAAEHDPERRRILAKAGQQMRQAIELAEANEAAAHVLADTALRGCQSALKYHDPLIPILSVAVERVRAKS